MSNLDVFLKDLDRFNDVVEEDAVKCFKKYVSECFRRIVMKTPVDTGAARGDWGIGINKFAKNKTAGNLKLGDIAYISNDMDYINELEDGSSQQAPNGMVAVTTEELRNMKCL